LDGCADGIDDGLLLGLTVGCADGFDVGINVGEDVGAGNIEYCIFAIPYPLPLKEFTTSMLSFELYALVTIEVVSDWVV